MKATPNSVFENSPVSQGPEESVFSEMELWEPPFERWIRLADILLGNAPDIPRPIRPTTPQSLSVISGH